MCLLKTKQQQDINFDENFWKEKTVTGTDAIALPKKPFSFEITPM
jgi:hypothetical protein